MLGRVREGVALLSAVRQESLENEYFYCFAGTDLILSIAAVLEGRFAQGIKGMESYIAHREREGYRAAADWGRIYLAEVYLELLTSKQKPPLGTVLRNLTFLVRVLPFAPQRALNLLTKASENKQFSPSGTLTARIQMNFGLVYKVTKRFDLARRHLQKAQELAKPLEATTMVEKIDAALAELR
jgi:tetratricopeptide (TPR) repeat protein